MSTAKVIFTYKRKRLSSRFGVGNANVCTDFSSSDVQAEEHQDAPKEKIKSPDKNLMISKCVNCNDVDRSMDCRSCLEPFDNKIQHVCHGEEMPACSTLTLHNSSRLREKYDVQRSDTMKTKDLTGSNAFTAVGKNDSVGAALGETTNSNEKDSCLLHASYLDDEGSMQGGSVSQSVKDYTMLCKQSYLSKTVVKGKSSAPLRTFSRRLKRKADTCDAGMLTKLPCIEGDAAVKVCGSGPLSYTCEVESKQNSLVEKSLDMKVESSDDTRNTLCQNSEQVTSNEIGDSLCPCRQSCAETLLMRQTEVTSDSQEDLIGDISPVAKRSAIRTSGSVASAFHNPDAIGSTKKDVRGSSNDGTVVLSCNVACKMDVLPMSQQCRASSGESQLTSSDSSDLKIGVANRVDHRTCSNLLDVSRPPPGAVVIDCNVVPESDVHEAASDIIRDSVMIKSNEKVVQEGKIKSKGLQLNEHDSVPMEDSPDVPTSIKKETKPKTKCLQLFSDDVKCSQFTPSNTLSETSHSKPQPNVASILDRQRHQLHQSSGKASATIGSSLHMGPIYEGQTSKNGPTTHLFQNSNVNTCDLIQNPVVQSFPDQASFRHKLLLESINTRATSLRGNRNISLDKFEPCPAMWSEEELDSLWIGIRRHGRGNWHAMLLDPRLRFAPWRTAGDLEEQWGREQFKLFSGQQMPSSRYLKPQDAYKVHCHGPVVCHGAGGRRENVAAGTQLSLGDVYAQKEGVCSRSSAPSYGITQAQKHVTMASSVGSYACGLFNNVPANLMIRSEVPSDAPATAFGMNNCLPHWLRNPISTLSRPLDPSLPPNSALPQMGGLQMAHAFPETSRTSCKGKNQINTKVAEVKPPSHLQCGNPLTSKPGLADNFIVIESDASSEETISDDHNIRN